MRTVSLTIGLFICLLGGLTAAPAGTRMVAPGPATPAPSPPAAAIAEVEPLSLPAPTVKSEVSIEESLSRRRSVRDFAPERLTPAQIGQLLWAAQGITERERGLRTAPSAMGLYPLHLYVVKDDGVFEYRPLGHVLLPRASEDRRARLAVAAGEQDWVRQAPVSLVITGTAARVKEKAGGRAERYVFLEAGHAAQNVLLQAVSLGLTSVPVGAFDDRAMAAALGLPEGEVPIYVLPVGRPALK